MNDIIKHIQGIIYFWSWNCSIFAGYLLFVPLSILELFTPKFYRQLVDLIVTFWQYYVTTLIFRQNCKVYVTGDPIQSNEISLIVSNHRTRVDWNFLWAVMYHAVQGEGRWWYGTKFVLKNSIRNIPGAGWVMQLAMYIFIKRNWKNDKSVFDNYIEYVKDNQYKHALILFPEGTDLTSKTLEKSDRYAKNKGLSQYKNVLHPRTTGFAYLADEMRKNQCLDAVYDLTLIYPDECPQNEEELFVKGKFPGKVVAHLVKYPIAVLPEGQENLKIFLENLWKYKERYITEFRQRDPTHFQSKLLSKEGSLTITRAYLTHIFWMSLLAILTFLVTFSRWYFYITIMYTIGLYVVPLFIQLSVFKVRKKFLTLIRGKSIKDK
ncbi:hypothetical protein ABEB36_014259 [Hypothenemus hampei]|uniref:Phospholipid/glycerol acyltransferase domain-containing protein n=1 Tax=Hypothenemus hampei TaxID=57062 RepID=A0ABD1E4Q7_HYPHA